MKKSLIYQLDQLEYRTSVLRRRLGFSARGEMLFQAPRSMWSENDVVVEADGIGGAKLIIVEGNYPANYLIHKEQCFRSEEEACEAAEKLIEPKTIRR